jgi:Protein of unknown function (DUF3164)
MASDFTPAFIPDGRIDLDGQPYMGDAKGNLVPVRLIKQQHLMEDELVRDEIGWALALSEQVKRFKQHLFDNLGAFEALLAEQYGATIGGKKGNKTLMTHDGMFKISVQVADNIVFGPELQIAKALVDECLNEWATGSRDEIRTIVTRAFNTDKEGQINRAEIFMLLRLDIDDARWKRAMEAIRDAMRVEGSKTYVRCYMRPNVEAAWQPITIDLAKA